MRKLQRFYKPKLYSLMLKRSLRVAAFTLAELMVVLIIIGILVLLALPNFQNVIGQTHAVEAQEQLRHLYNLEKMQYQKRFTYSNDLRAIGFEQPKTLSQGGQGKYIYEVVAAAKTTFLVKAIATEDFDGDGILNEWQIDHESNLQETIPD